MVAMVSPARGFFFGRAVGIENKEAVRPAVPPPLGLYLARG